MKTTTQKTASKTFHFLRTVFKEIAPLIVPTILFAGCLYCCFMEATTFPAR